MNGAQSSSAIYSGVVMHHRCTAPVHRFEYPLFMWLLDLAELPALERRVTGFGHNRPRPIAFHDADHFAGSDQPALEQLRGLVEHQGLTWPAGPVRVLTHCRIFSYVFNPVTFWYCFTPKGILDVVVAEVNNTFGDRHCYVASRAQWQAETEGLYPTQWARWTDKKVFHVSPFFSLDGTYAFALQPPGDRLRARIDLRVQGELKLVTMLALEREALNRTSVARVLIRYPLMTARVVGAIHWEAIRLRRKGARYHVRPPYDPERARGGLE